MKTFLAVGGGAMWAITSALWARDGYWLLLSSSALAWVVYASIVASNWATKSSPPTLPNEEAMLDAARSYRVQSLRLRQAALEAEIAAFRCEHGRDPDDGEMTDVFASAGLAIRPK